MVGLGAEGGFIGSVSAVYSTVQKHRDRCGSDISADGFSDGKEHPEALVHRIIEW